MSWIWDGGQPGRDMRLTSLPESDKGTPPLIHPATKPSGDEIFGKRHQGHRL